MLIQPAIEVEIVVLLGPQHACKRLAMHALLVFAQRFGSDAFVKLVGVGKSASEDLVEIGKRVGCRLAPKRRRTTLEPPAGTSRT